MALDLAFCRFDAANLGSGKGVAFSSPGPIHSASLSRVEQRTVQSQIGRNLVSTLLKRNYPEIEIDSPDYSWVTGETGKPQWLDSNLHFNIAHSRNVVVAAIGDMPLGIDVEVVRGVSRKLIQRFLPAIFQEYCLSGGEEEIPYRFFSFWTACESLGKRRGDGVMTVLNQADSLFILPPTFDLGSETRIKHYSLLPGVIAAVCGEYNRLPENVVEIPIHELIQRAPQ